MNFINMSIQIEMKPGDYRITVHVWEAKDIKAKGKAGGGGLLANFEGETADPMVDVLICYFFNHLGLNHRLRSCPSQSVQTTRQANYLLFSISNYSLNIQILLLMIWKLE